MALNAFDDALEHVADEQAPSSADPFDRALSQIAEEDRRERETRLRVASSAVADLPPDRTAEALRIAKQRGLPASFVVRNFDAIKAHTPAIDPADLQRDAPKLADWLTDPVNNAVAKDDVHNLSSLERAFTIGRNLTPAAVSGLVRGAQGVVGLAQAGSELFDDLVGRSGALLRGSLMNRTALQASTGYESPITRRLRDATAAMGTVADVLAPPPDDRFLERGIYGGVASIGQQLPGIAATFLVGPEVGLPMIGGTTGGQAYVQARTSQAPYPTKPVPGQIAPGNIDLYAQPRVRNADGSISTVDSFSVELDGKEVLLPTVLPDGRHVSQDEAVAEYKRTGQHLGTFATPSAATAYATRLHEDYAAGLYDQRPAPLSVERAIAFAAFQGAVEVATEEIPLKWLVGDLAKRSGLLTTLAKQIASEIPGEEIATALQDMAEFVALPANKDRTWADYRAERWSAAAETAWSSIVAVGALTIPAHATARMLERTGEAATESKTLQRAPEQVGELVAQATADRPNLYVPVDAWTDYWQKQGVNPAEKAAQLTGDPDAYAHAQQATGELLVIPKAEYVKELQRNPDANAFFVEHASEDPEIMNRAQTQTFTQALDAALAKEPVPDESPAAAVRKDLIAQLTAAGESKTRAESYARLWEAVIGTLGQRAGIDPAELYKRYQLQVTRNDRGQPIAPAEAAALEQPDARYESDLARGVFRFGDDRGFRIELFQNANASTFLHESGHAFLEILRDLAKEPGGEQFRTDLATLQTWFGAKSAERMVDKKGRLKTKYHEQFARGFEAYLRDGTAPNPELRSLFARFKTWLTRIYQSLRELDVELSPDVRGVFDRLVATDAAIEAARAEAQIQPLFIDAESAGMTDAAFDTYRRDVADESARAQDDLAQRIAKAQAREQQAWWKAERETMRAAIAAEIHQEPVYRAEAAIRTGTNPDGSPLLAAPPKLAKADLVNRYTADELTRLRRRQLYAAEGGTSPDLVAEQFGFASGDELVRALLAAPAMKAAIEAETTRRMQAKHGDPVDPAVLREQAIEAVHGEHRRRIVETELKALTKGIERAVIPSKEAIAQYVARRISGMATRALRPGLFLQAAQRASAQAFELKDTDRVGAVQAKQRELVSLALYREALRVKDEVAAAKTQWGKFFRADDQVARTRNLDYVNAARAIVAPLLERGVRLEDATEALKVLRTYDPQMGEIVDHYVSAANFGRPLADLTVEDFRATRDVVSGLWAIARRERQIEIDGKLVDRDQAVAALRAQLQTGGRGAFADFGKAGAPTPWQEAQKAALGGKAWFRRVESWVTARDGGQQGPFRTYLWNPVKEAINRFRIEKVERMREYKALLDPIQDTLTAAKIAAPELGYTFGNNGRGGMAELLGAILHSGNRSANTSNLAKLLVGRGWGEFRRDGSLDTSRWDAFIARMQREGVLTKAHYDFAQGVWDLFESLKPGLQQAHRAVYGFYFEEVQADAIDTPWGPYRGGYVPALADALLSEQAEIRNEKQMAFEEGASFNLPSVGRKSTIARVQHFDTLAMNLNFIPQHIDWALRFTHVQPAVKDVTRIVTDKGWRAELSAHDPQAAAQMLMPWLMRAATQRISEKGKSRDLDRVFTGLRSRTAMQALTVNVTNALQQLTGGFVASVKIRQKRRLVAALFRYLRAPVEIGAGIRADSAFMETFLTSQAHEIQRQVDDIVLNPSIYGKTTAYLRAHGQILTEITQNLINHVAWLAARDEATANGLSRLEAIRHADSVVRETQGSFFPEDVSRFEANTPFVRAMSMFGSYFNMVGNLMVTESGNAVRMDRGGLARAARVASVWTLGYMVPNALANAILNAVKGSWDDDDDDTHLDELLNLLLAPSVKTAFSTLPIVGQFGLAAYGALTTDATYDDDIRVSPTAGMIGAAIKDLAGHSSRKQVVQHVLSGLGLITNLPLGALGKPAGFLLDYEEGKARPSTPIEFAQGLVTGSSPDQRTGR